MAGGRPTKYTPELIEKAYKYMDEWRTLGDMIPSHDALTGYLGITPSTLYLWDRQEDKAEFSQILETILVMQRQELINNGLSGDFNAAITKLVLGKHGYSEKVDSTNESTHTIKTPDLKVQFVDASEDTDSV